MSGIITSLHPVVIGDATPKPEETMPIVGDTMAAARENHVHPRITSVTQGTLNASGEATITFTLPFTAMPFCSFSYVELADNAPINFKVKSWVMTNGKYTGCVVKAYRGQPLPNNILTLLSLVSFNVFGGSAYNVVFTCMAIPQS